jgi:glutamate synthase domain-containing protein 3
VGIATQRDDLRRKFPGRPENVVNFFLGLAEQVRLLLAQLGVRRLDEIIGDAGRLRVRAGVRARLDASPLLAEALAAAGVADATAPAGAAPRGAAAGPDAARRPRRNVQRRNDRPEVPFDEDHLLPLLARVEAGEAVEAHFAINNTHRAVGARLAGAIAARWGDEGLPEGTVRLTFTGTAGQSFGAFLVPGMHLRLVGEANDYVGKGAAGGEIAITPPAPLLAESHRHVIAGNTVLYGATGGRLFAAGRVGERFAVRNSGATAVVEGCGDHGCEYMTGGVVVILGAVGRNFGAGMTGGEAFVYDDADSLPLRYNTQLVTITRPDDHDAERLRALVAAHYEATGSRRARMLLANWDAHRTRFWKVAPKGAAQPRERGASGPEVLPATRPASAP